MLKSPTRYVELLAPARNYESGCDAIRCGADAVYIGAAGFGARAAAGADLEQIGKLCDFAHRFRARVYVAMNILLFDPELEAAEKLAWQLWEAGADALIVQDMAYTRMNLPPIALHASTQVCNRDADRIRFLSEAGFSRVILERALNLAEIRTISARLGLHPAAARNVSEPHAVAAYAFPNRAGERSSGAQATANRGGKCPGDELAPASGGGLRGRESDGISMELPQTDREPAEHPGVPAREDRKDSAPDTTSAGLCGSARGGRPLTCGTACSRPAPGTAAKTARCHAGEEPGSTHPGRRPVELEAFIHGAICVGYSGRCYMSRTMSDRSGNRGVCAQSCRLPYRLLDERFQPLRELPAGAAFGLPGKDLASRGTTGTATILSGRESPEISSSADAVPANGPGGFAAPSAGKGSDPRIPANAGDAGTGFGKPYCPGDPGDPPHGPDRNASIKAANAPEYPASGPSHGVSGGKKHFLSVRDLNATSRLEDLLLAGVTSFKIEGRLKDTAYVRNVVSWYRRELDRIIEKHPGFARASIGESVVGFEPDPAKSFSRGGTSYYLDGKYRKVGSFDTPKAVGELVGTVTGSTGAYLNISGQPLSNADGICFPDGDGGFTGVRVSSVENGKYRLNRPLKVTPGTPVYRNYDHRFVSAVLGDNPRRLIPVQARAEWSGTCFSLTLELSGHLPGYTAADPLQSVAAEQMACTTVDRPASNGTMIQAGRSSCPATGPEKGLSAESPAPALGPEGNIAEPIASGVHAPGLTKATATAGLSGAQAVSDRPGAGVSDGFPFVEEPETELGTLKTPGIAASELYAPQTGLSPLTVTETVNGSFEPAKDPDKSRRTLTAQIQKTGGTLFRITETILPPGPTRFIPISVINAVRRAALERLEKKLVQSYRREERAPEDPEARFPTDRLTGADNVTNVLSRRFYEDHGVEHFPEPYEQTRDLRGLPVMRMKYCLRREMEMCLRRSPSYTGELFLEHEGYLYALSFDCGSCEMSVIYRGKRPELLTAAITGAKTVTEKRSGPGRKRAGRNRPDKPENISGRNRRECAGKPFREAGSCKGAEGRSDKLAAASPENTGKRSGRNGQGVSGGEGPETESRKRSASRSRPKNPKTGR